MSQYAIASKHWPGLAKLIEECGEVVQAAAKIIGTNGTMVYDDQAAVDEYALLDEIGDVLAAIEFFAKRNGVPMPYVHGRMQMKLRQFNKWYEEEGEPK